MNFTDRGTGNTEEMIPIENLQFNKKPPKPKRVSFLLYLPFLSSFPPSSFPSFIFSLFILHFGLLWLLLPFFSLQTFIFCVLKRIYSLKIQKLQAIGTKNITTVEELRLEHIHPTEFARQMALVDHRLFRAIKPQELLHMNWTNSLSKHEKSPNVIRMIKQFNRVGQWVISSLVTCQNLDKRIKILSKLIHIAFESFRLSNVNGTMAFISALKNSFIVRLRSTWVRFLLLSMHHSGRDPALLELITFF